MRDLVHLRDEHCIFPRCQVDAKSCDLDHTIPYDETGPPGQTTPANLASLCRRHHRAKTTGRWRYLRTPDGDYLWHGPYGTTYLVTVRGHRRSHAPLERVRDTERWTEQLDPAGEREGRESLRVDRPGWELREVLEVLLRARGCRDDQQSRGCVADVLESVRHSAWAEGHPTLGHPERGVTCLEPVLALEDVPHLVIVDVAVQGRSVPGSC